MSPIVRMSFRSVPYGVYPLFCVMGLFVSGVTYTSYHFLTRGDAVSMPWQKGKDKHTWLKIKSDENNKMLSYHGANLKQAMKEYKEYKE